MFRKKKNLLKEKLIEDQQTEEVYKFYDENKPQERIQIEAILNKNNSYKVLVIINDKNSTIDYLCMEIAEQMEKYSQFENLEGLKAINLTKKTEKGLLKLPITGEISEFISNGDAIYCDLITEEYWVKSTIKINSINTNLIINLDIKFRLESMIKKLRFLLMKLGINYWIDTVSELDDHYHYIFTSLNFKTLKAKNNIEYNLSDLKKGVSIEKSK